MADLVRELGVSDMTDPAGPRAARTTRACIEKVHGGATALPGSALFEPGVRRRSRRCSSSRRRPSPTAAVGFVEPGTAIGISAGTTTYAMARRLLDVPGLTVVTNSLPVADVLYTSRAAPTRRSS